MASCSKSSALSPRREFQDREAARRPGVGAAIRDHDEAPRPRTSGVRRGRLRRDALCCATPQNGAAANGRGHRLRCVHGAVNYWSALVKFAIFLNTAVQWNDTKLGAFNAQCYFRVRGIVGVYFCKFIRPSSSKVASLGPKRHFGVRSSATIHAGDKSR